MTNFKIGQEVVCVKDHSERIVTKGKHYFINNILVCSKCGDLAFDVGIGTDTPISLCRCGEEDFNMGAYLVSQELFAPLETIPESHEKTVEKLIEESNLITI